MTISKGAALWDDRRIEELKREANSAGFVLITIEEMWKRTCDLVDLGSADLAGKITAAEMRGRVEELNRMRLPLLEEIERLNKQIEDNNEYTGRVLGVADEWSEANQLCRAAIRRNKHDLAAIDARISELKEMGK